MCRYSIGVLSNMFRLTVALCAIALGAALELTPDNWDDATAGKTVFIKVGVVYSRVTNSRSHKRTLFGPMPHYSFSRLGEDIAKS